MKQPNSNSKNLYPKALRLSLPLLAALCFSCGGTPIASSNPSLEPSSSAASSEPGSSSSPSSSTQPSSTSSQDPVENAAKQLNQPNKPYGQGSSSMAKEYVDSMKGFSQRLYDIASQKKEGESLMFCPLSLATCFSMAYDGAKGDTKAELKEAFSIPDNHLEYIRDMTKRMHMDLHDSEGNQQIYSEVAEAFFVDNGLEPYLKDDYIDTLTSSYYAEAFSGQLNSDPMHQSLADFINQKTNDFFHLTKEDFEDLEGVLWLVNTVYMKANWINKFGEVEQRKLSQFENAKGEKEEASYIRSVFEGEVYETDSYYLANVPLYGRFSFRLLLPKEGVEESSDAFFPDLLSESKAGEPYKAEIDLTLPQFKAHSKYSMVSEGYLSELGIAKATNPSLADLTGIAEVPDTNLYINEAIHEAGIDVNKDGIEAAAYTIIEVAETAIPQDPLPRVKITADHPFLYSIVSNNDELPLFVGRLNSLAN